QFADWLYGSAGYLYSRLDADSSFNDTVTFNGAQNFLSQVPQITLEKESHAGNLNSLVGPFEGLSLSGGVQAESTRQQGFGQGNLNRFTYSLTAPVTLAVVPS